MKLVEVIEPITRMMLTCKQSRHHINEAQYVAIKQCTWTKLLFFSNKPHCNTTIMGLEIRVEMGRLGE